MDTEKDYFTEGINRILDYFLDILGKLEGLVDEFIKDLTDAIDEIGKNIDSIDQGIDELEDTMEGLRPHIPDSELVHKVAIRYTHVESDGSGEEWIPAGNGFTGPPPVLLKEFMLTPFWSTRVKFKCGGNFSDWGEYWTTIGCPGDPKVALRKYLEIFPYKDLQLATSFPHTKSGVRFVPAWGYTPELKELLNGYYMQHIYSTSGDDAYGEYLWTPNHTFRYDDFIFIITVTRSGDGGNARRNATIEMWSA